MPRLGTALSARIHLAVQLGALLVPSLLVTGDPNTFLMATSARMGYLINGVVQFSKPPGKSAAAPSIFTVSR